MPMLVTLNDVSVILLSLVHFVSCSGSLCVTVSGTQLLEKTTSERNVCFYCNRPPRVECRPDGCTVQAYPPAYRNVVNVPCHYTTHLDVKQVWYSNVSHTATLQCMIIFYSVKKVTVSNGTIVILNYSWTILIFELNIAYHYTIFFWISAFEPLASSSVACTYWPIRLYNYLFMLFIVAHTFTNNMNVHNSE